MITKDEFTKHYAQDSGLTLDEFHSYFKVIPCIDCDYADCKGWQVVSKDFQAWKTFSGTRSEYDERNREWAKKMGVDL